MSARDDVRTLHDEAARSGDPVLESTRPLGTRNVEIRRMVADVRRTLRLTPDVSLLDLGCGTGVLGLPLARTVKSYLGVDFSAKAVATLRSRLADLPRADAMSADLMSVSPETLGRHDRVLLYATLHYATSEAEGRALVDLALACLRPGGLLLIGNLPLPPEELPHGPARRAAGLAWRVARRLIPSPRRDGVVEVPRPDFVRLDRPLVETWLRAHGAIWRWRAPAAGVPLGATRADLVVELGPPGNR